MALDRSMAIKAVCECGKKFEAKDEYEGRRAICPSCKREFVFQRGGIPIFQEIVEPPPLLPIRVEDDDDQCLPEPTPRPEPSRPFWKDPIVVFGWGTPMLALVAFCVYVSWPQAQPKHPVAQPRDVGIPRRIPKIPVEVSYKIIKEVIGYGGTRRSVTVLLNTKVPEGVLRENALEIKATETAAYSDTLLWYYLSGKGPEMEPHRRAWARGSFRPGTDNGVTIMGLTIEEEKLLLNEPLSLPSGSVPLGSWLDYEAQCRYTIYRTGGNWFLQHVDGNGRLGHVIPPSTLPPWVQELEQLTASEGLAFRPRGSSERWLVDPKGILQMVASDGRVFSNPDPINLRLTAVKD
jgi:hypothetical protein